MIEVAKTHFQKFKGLMFSNKKSILFIFKEEKIIPIHSLFVFFDFYAVYLDKNFKVLEIYHVKPFSIYISNKKRAKYLLETPKLNNIKIGDTLDWLESYK